MSETARLVKMESCAAGLPLWRLELTPPPPQPVGVKQSMLVGRVEVKVPLNPVSDTF